MSIIEILDELERNYELKVENENVSFQDIKNYIMRLEKDVNDMIEIVRIKNFNAARDREIIKKLRGKG